MPKLTSNQIEILRLMQQPEAIVYYMEYMGRFNPNPYYFINAGLKKCTKQIEALLKAGLAEQYDENRYSARHKVRLTEAGRNWK